VGRGRPLAKESTALQQRGVAAKAMIIAVFHQTASGVDMVDQFPRHEDYERLAEAASRG